MKGVLGIDPGLNGGFAVVGHEVKLFTQDFPILAGRLDISDLFASLTSLKHSFDKAYIEDVHAIFGSSAKNTFEFGRICGQLEAILTLLHVPFEYVKPKEWQKSFFSIGGKLTPKERKERCILAAKRIFPNERFLATERSRVPHTGMIDAALIAEFGLRKEKGVVSP